MKAGNASEVLDLLTPQSTDAEIIDALLDAFFLCSGSHGLLVQHTLQRVRRDQLNEKLWPKPEGARVLAGSRAQELLEQVKREPAQEQVVQVEPPKKGKKK